jgi:hypothetical protein
VAGEKQHENSHEDENIPILLLLLLMLRRGENGEVEEVPENKNDSNVSKSTTSERKAETRKGEYRENNTDIPISLFVEEEEEELDEVRG